MRGLLIRAMFGATVLVACKSAARPDCVCTTSFLSIVVTVVDTAGAPVPSLSPTITVRSTGRLLVPAAPAIGQGWYPVVSDGDMNQFALDGDTLHFAVSSPPRSAAGDFVVDAPGPCRCHIHLVAGPDTLVLR